MTLHRYLAEVDPGIFKGGSGLTSGVAIIKVVMYK